MGKLSEEELNEYLENYYDQFNISEENFLLDSLKFILNQYERYIKNIYAKFDHGQQYNYEDYNSDEKKLYHFIGELFPSKLNEILNNDYICDGSTGVSKPPFVPWITIKLDEGTGRGYYVCYLFKADLTGVYLSFALGAEQYDNKRSLIESNKNKFRQLLIYFYNSLNPNDNILDDEIQLLCKGTWGKDKSCTRPECYEKGTIFCKYYDLNDDFNNSENPLSEMKLKEDLNKFLELYHFADQYKIFDKISDENYSFEYEVAAFELVESINSIRNLFENDNSINYPEQVTKLNDCWNEFSKLAPSQRDKYKFKNNSYFENNIFYLNFGYNRVLNEFKKGYYIFLKIDLNENLIEFGLTSPTDETNELNRSCLSYIHNKLYDKFKNQDLNLNLEDEFISSGCLDLDNLNQINFLESFKNLMNFYETSISDYICFMFNKIILNDDSLFVKDLVEFNEDVNLNPDEMHKKLVDKLLIDKKVIYKICAALNSGKNIIFNGVPGTGKTELAKFISKEASGNYISDYLLTTATSDWSTFDTIGGWIPDKDNDGSLKFHEGVFLEAIRENKWLIIDEINRADIDKAFGQLFTILSGNITEIELPYVNQEGKPIFIKRWEKNYSTASKDNSIYYIGKNWRIIGTMNDDDKDSLFDLSYAFMRRFMFIGIDVPNVVDFKNLLDDWVKNLDPKDEFSQILIRIYNIESNPKDLGPALFKDMVEYIEERTKFSNENNTNELINESIESYIVPQLEGASDDEIKSIIKDLNNMEFEDDSGYDFKLSESVEKKLESFYSNMVNHERI